jgi:hypothetical protein
LVVSATFRLSRVKTTLSELMNEHALRRDGVTGSVSQRGARVSGFGFRVEFSGHRRDRKKVTLINYLSSLIKKMLIKKMSIQSSLCRVLTVICKRLRGGWRGRDRETERQRDRETERQRERERERERGTGERERARVGVMSGRRLTVPLYGRDT